MALLASQIRNRVRAGSPPMKGFPDCKQAGASKLGADHALRRTPCARHVSAPTASMSAVNARSRSSVARWGESRSTRPRIGPSRYEAKPARLLHLGDPSSRFDRTRILRQFPPPPQLSGNLGCSAWHGLTNGVHSNPKMSIRVGINPLVQAHFLISRWRRQAVRQCCMMRSIEPLCRLGRVCVLQATRIAVQPLGLHGAAKSGGSQP